MRTAACQRHMMAAGARGAPCAAIHCEKVVLLNMLEPLDRLRMGQSARIAALEGRDTARLRDLGFVEDSLVTKQFASAFGDPCAYRVRGAVVALRGRDARRIVCQTAGGDA